MKNKIKVGISTASLFKRFYNEESVKILNSFGVRNMEIFLGTYREYKTEYANLLLQNKGDAGVHSIHTLNTHFEPQLFSANPRAKEDAYCICEDVLACAKILGARYYTFHGVARIKRKIAYDNYEAIGGGFRILTDKCAEYGVQLALENVEWAYYNHPGFYKGVKQFCPALKGTLDIKQARDSGEGYVPFLNEMGEDVVTVHVSDINEDGNLCLPGTGRFDFDELFRRLADYNFGGAVLIEVYKENYDELSQLINSHEYLCDLAEKFNL